MRPVYVSFDRVPAPKGAAVHIAAFARTLGRARGPIDLVVPGDGAETEPERWPGVDLVRLPARGRDLFERAACFRAELARWWGPLRPIAHFRSIFEGYPLARHKDRAAERLVYEVNGLPSIELKYHHARVAEDPELLRKLRAQEDVCLAAADRVVTPSAVTAEHLASRGVPRDKLRVIRNGVDLDTFSYCEPRPHLGRPLELLYAGTLAPWQGLPVALEALALFRRDDDAALTAIGPARGRQGARFDDAVRDLGLGDRVRRLAPLAQLDLAAAYHACDVALAPLPANDRNAVQGCSPLKVLEAMACGRPLVASDLPAVRELARNGEHALLVRPGSAKAIKDALLRLRAEPGLGPRLASAARRRVERDFGWKRAGRELLAVYEELDSSSTSAPNRSTSPSGA